MDVDLTIRYSDERLCEVVVCRPNDETPLYRIVSRRAHLGEGLTEAMRDARRLYEVTFWPYRHRRHDAQISARNFPEQVSATACATARQGQSFAFGDHRNSGRLA
jgi:hypothetical protein